MMMRFVIAVAVAALAGCGTGSSSRTTAEIMGAVDPDACAQALDAHQISYAACRSAEMFRADQARAIEKRCDAEARALRPTDADVSEVAKHLGGQASSEDIYGVAWLNVIAAHYTQCMAAAGYRKGPSRKE
jgi:hypothetical protein